MFTIILFVITISVIMASGLITIKGTVNHKDLFFLPKSYTTNLRGLAMVMIIFGHVANTYHEGVWFSPFASIGVAIFLFLSGYGNSESYINKRSFKINKILKIVIPYWLIVLFLFIIKYDEFSLPKLIYSLLFIKPLISGYWFVNYIFICYFVFWFSVNFFYRLRWIILITFTIVSFFFFQPLASEQSLSFILGIFISEKKEYISKLNKKRLFAIATYFFCFGI